MANCRCPFAKVIMAGCEGCCSFGSSEYWLLFVERHAAHSSLCPSAGTKHDLEYATVFVEAHRVNQAGDRAHF